MNVVTDGILIASAASLTLGAIYLRFWIADRSRMYHLAFAISCISVSGCAWFERALMLATTPAEFGELLRWAHIPTWAALLSVPWFVGSYLRAGRPWLFWGTCLLRTIALVLNFTFSPNLNFREITEIIWMPLFGQLVSVPVGVPNPWMLSAHASLFLLFCFTLDATMTAWRRGDHTKALWVGGSSVFFSAGSLVILVSVFWGHLQFPIFISFLYTVMLAVMGTELSSDMRRVKRLSRELAESDLKLLETRTQLGMSASAANVGLWTRRFEDNKIWANEQWCAMFEFELGKDIGFDDFLRRVHPDDRDRIADAFKVAMDGGVDYATEYRSVLKSGEIRWIRSRARIEFVDGDPSLIRGASLDITMLKLAQEEVHDLSGRLIDGQENERARIARELHDDLSQSLALVSINLEILGRESNKPDELRSGINDLIDQIDKLSTDVHRISHELHPSKLEQLGLESAVQGFCREISAAHGLNIKFNAGNMPRMIHDDAALCLYRIAQEALQNIVKHSGADSASVRLESDGVFVSLIVSDMGNGFDPEKMKSKESIGLIGMKERIRYVNGELSVDSKEGVGTKIRARVPVTPLGH
jgi:two-component system sensor kinase FixL